MSSLQNFAQFKRRLSNILRSKNKSIKKAKGGKSLKKDSRSRRMLHRSSGKSGSRRFSVRKRRSSLRK